MVSLIYIKFHSKYSGFYFIFMDFCFRWRYARVVFKGDSTSGTVLRLGATSAIADDGIAIFAKGSSDPNLYLSVSGDEIPLLLRKTNIKQLIRMHRVNFFQSSAKQSTATRQRLRT